MYGVVEPAQTAKAPHSQKIKLLFNFLKDDKDNGIKSVDFTKMVTPFPPSSTTTPRTNSNKY